MGFNVNWDSFLGQIPWFGGLGFTFLHWLDTGYGVYTDEGFRSNGHWTKGNSSAGSHGFLGTPSWVALEQDRESRVKWDKFYDKDFLTMLLDLFGGKL
jgi:hypothetical protein